MNVLRRSVVQSATQISQGRRIEANFLGCLLDPPRRPTRILASQVLPRRRVPLTACEKKADEKDRDDRSERALHENRAPIHIEHPFLSARSGTVVCPSNVQAQRPPGR